MNSNISQQIDEILRPLERLPKSFCGDLAQKLDEYILYMSQVYEEDGAAYIDFRQAGTVIQNMSLMYAVNVEIVYKMMEQLLDLLRTNRRVVNDSADEGTSRAGTSHERDTNPVSEPVVRRRRTLQCSEDFEDFEPRVINCDMRPQDRNNSIKPVPVHRLVLDKSTLKRRKNPYNVYDVDKDDLDTTELSLMYQVSRLGKLQHNMLKEVIAEDQNGERNVEELMQVLTHLVRELSSTVTDIPELDSNPPSVRCNSPESDLHEIETLPATPPPSPASMKRSASVIDTPLPIKRSTSTVESDDDHERAAGRPAEPNPRDNVVTVPVEELVTPDEDPWETVPVGEVMDNRILETRPTVIVPGSLLIPKKEQTDEKEVPKKTPPTLHNKGPKLMVMAEYLERNMICMYVQDSNFPIDPELRMFYIQENRKKKVTLRRHSKITARLKYNMDILHRRLAANITEEFRGFEDMEPDSGDEEGFRGFGTENQRSEETNTSGVEPQVEDLPVCAGDIEPPDASEDILPLGCSEGLEQPACSLDVELPGCSEGVELPGCSEDAELPGCSEDVNQPGCSEEQLNCSEVTQENMNGKRLKEMVLEWHKFLQPRIVRACERKHFDIHGIGTEILDSFSGQADDSVLQFRQITADRPREDVARYFLAALQLANTYNVEISQSVPGDLAMDCMQIRLISSTRHHEALEEYEAPSQGARKRRHMSPQPSCSFQNTDGFKNNASYSDSGSDSDSSYHRKNKRTKR